MNDSIVRDLRWTAPEAAEPAVLDWASLPELSLDPRRLARNRVVSAARVDPAHVAFDLLRTRMMQALKARGWTRVGITSPTKGCGKTFVSTNLALSLARRTSTRTLLLDLDLRIPSLARALGVAAPGPIRDLLEGEVQPSAHLQRIGRNLAVGLNSDPVSDSAELLQEATTRAALDGLQASLRPDVILFDLPPTLACDDVLAFLPQLDALLLVAGGGATSARDIRDCERLYGDQVPLLGVILNKADDPTLEPYYS